MYKVFIDHKPIILVNPTKIKNEWISIESELIKNISKDITKQLKLASLDEPLQIVCQNCETEFSRLFKKHTIIKAAGGVVRNTKGILMIYRNDLWDIPKGKVEKKEKIKVAAVREVEEECGINGPMIQKKLINTYHTYTYKKKKVLKKTYWFVMDYNGKDKLVPQTKEGITKVKWMSKDEFISVRGNTYGSINAVIEAYDENYF